MFYKRIDNLSINKNPGVPLTSRNQKCADYFIRVLSWNF